MLTIEQMQEKVQSALSIKRFIHTTGVVTTADALAKHYGQDPQKAQIAALLHDCAKDYPHTLSIRLCDEYHIDLDTKKYPAIIHSFLGAEIACREYGIADADILNAIRYHSTGRVGMSMLEKIIYIADYTEPNRREFDALEPAREAAFKDITVAIAIAASATVHYLEMKHRPVFPLTRELLNDYKKLEAIN